MYEFCTFTYYNQSFWIAMSKFGELIDLDIPVLLDFYTEWNEQSTAMHPVLRDVAAALGDSAKVIKIDVDKNSELAEEWWDEMETKRRTRCQHSNWFGKRVRLDFLNL